LTAHHKIAGKRESRGDALGGEIVYSQLIDCKEKHGVIDGESGSTYCNKGQEFQSSILKRVLSQEKKCTRTHKIVMSIASAHADAAA
jgi:hypothetical protein